MNKKFALILSILSLFISSSSIADSAKKYKYYDGYEELPVSESDIFGFEQDNPGYHLVAIHIKYFSDKNCTKKLNIKYRDLSLEQKMSMPYKKTFTYINTRTKKPGIKQELYQCDK